MIVVSDTSPISALIRCDQLHLLQKLYDKILIPKKVFEELQYLVHYNISIDILTQSKWIKIKEVSSSFLVEKYNNEVEEGEAEALVLATEYKADLILADVLAARTLAIHLGFKTKGLLGIFLEAESKGFIENSQLIQELIASKIVWISNKVYEQYLTSLKKIK